jgi:hypothetical protein
LSGVWYTYPLKKRNKPAACGGDVEGRVRGLLASSTGWESGLAAPLLLLMRGVEMEEERQYIMRDFKILFPRGQFACKCGCGFNEIDEKVVAIVDVIQTVAPEAVVSSGCRCEKHNLEEGGKPSSAHLRGLAADIACINSQVRYIVLRTLFNRNVRRIGIGKTFVHFDLDQELPQWVGWIY